MTLVMRVRVEWSVCVALSTRSGGKEGGKKSEASRSQRPINLYDGKKLFGESHWFLSKFVVRHIGVYWRHTPKQKSQLLIEKVFFRFHFSYLSEFSIKINNKFRYFDHPKGHEFNAESKVTNQNRRCYFKASWFYFKQGTVNDRFLALVKREIFLYLMNGWVGLTHIRILMGLT